MATPERCEAADKSERQMANNQSIKLALSNMPRFHSWAGKTLRYSALDSYDVRYFQGTGPLILYLRTFKVAYGYI